MGRRWNRIFQSRNRKKISGIRSPQKSEKITQRGQSTQRFREYEKIGIGETVVTLALRYHFTPITLGRTCTSTLSIPLDTPKRKAPYVHRGFSFRDRTGYSWLPESPPEPSPPVGPWWLPPVAAAFCCFSRASLIRALRERRTLLPSMERTFTRTWSPSFSSSRTSRMRCSEI